MGNVQTIDGDALIRGALRVTGTPSVPAGSWDNADIAAAAGIVATKLQHQHAVTYSLIDGTAVVATTGDGYPIHTVYGAAGQIVAMDVVCPDAPSGGNLAFTVDLKVAGQGTAAATVLSSVVTVDSTSTDYEALTATVGTTAVSDGDTLLIVVATSGSTGTQGQGLVVTVTMREDAD